MDTPGRRGVQAVVVAISLFAFLMAAILWASRPATPLRPTDPNRPLDIGDINDWDAIRERTEKAMKEGDPRFKRPEFPNH